MPIYATVKENKRLSGEVCFKVLIRDGWQEKSMKEYKISFTLSGIKQYVYLVSYYHITEGINYLLIRC